MSRGTAAAFDGPTATGVDYLLQDATAGYGTVADGAFIADCRTAAYCY